MGRATISFRDHATRTRARWGFPDRISPRADGLGWDAEARTSLDGWVEVTDPIPVGLAWYGARTVRLTVKLPWTVQAPPAVLGSLYVRFGVDAVHWSDWQMLDRDVNAQTSETPETYRGSVGVPQRSSEAYQAKRVEMAKSSDLPVWGDEDRACAAIVKADPEYFARERPFVGWIELLWEGSIPGGARLPSIDVEWLTVVPGPIWPPKPSDEGPWRFRVGAPR
jgi:hypothetical protein